ncbi:hypothetical protein D3C85_1428250 [compost metagenome]
MGGAGVDHPHLRVVDCRHGLAGGGIGQAQQGDVGAVDRLAASLRVFAFGFGQGQQAQVAAVLQAGMDLQAGGALVTVDEDNRGVHGQSPVGEGWPMLACGSGKENLNMMIDIFIFSE